MADAKRSANFSSKEESILLSLVKQHIQILENKKTDSNNNKKKQECWKQIESQFNNESGEIFRDHMTLKKKYENLKKRTKKKIADEKCYTLGTGGGPAKKPPEIRDVDIEIKEILGDRISGHHSEFSGDAEIITIINDMEENRDANMDYGDNSGVFPHYDFDEMSSETPTTKSSETRGICKESTNENTEQKMDWSKYSVQSLRTPTSKSLAVGDSSKKKKRNEYDSMCGKVSQWAASKASLESVKIKFAEEEKNYKLKLMQEKFEKECELMKNESETKIKRIDREMEVTVEGIIEQNKLKKEILMLEKHILLQKLKSSNCE